jgi:hypothetical protein
MEAFFIAIADGRGALRDILPDTGARSCVDDGSTPGTLKSK